MAMGALINNHYFIHALRVFIPDCGHGEERPVLFHGFVIHWRAHQVIIGLAFLDVILPDLQFRLTEAITTFKSHVNS